MPPASNQNPTGNSKAAKFVAANPLGPMADPFSSLGTDENTELQKEVSDNVQKRLEKAMEDLKEKHRTGTNEVDDVDRAPTGAAYKALHEHQRQQARATHSAREREEERERLENNARVLEAREQMRQLKFEGKNNDDFENEKNNDNNDDDSGEDDDYDFLLDEGQDDELQQIRDARIAQLKHQQTQRAANLSLGHGSLRTIAQDDFLTECTGSSKFVIVHFYHDDFERCKIMDYHLRIIAEEHMEAKFLRIDAAKSPFFVSKLKVRVIPALFVFEDGKEVGRLAGFEGLARDAKKPDEWHTGRLQEWIASTGAIRYMKPTEEVEEERRRIGIVVRGSVYSDRERNGMVDEY